MKKILILILCNYCSAFLAGQISFEGIATYQLEYKNPNPKRVSDSVFYVLMKQLLKVKEHSIQKCYYKADKYLSITDALNQIMLSLRKEAGLGYGLQVNLPAPVSVSAGTQNSKIVW